MMAANEKSDAYNFGVVALETLMGKHLADILPALSTQWSEDIHMAEKLELRLPCPRSRQLIHDVLLSAPLALSCLDARPKARPSMKHVSQAFLANDSLLAQTLQTISLRQLQINAYSIMKNVTYGRALPKKGGNAEDEDEESCRRGDDDIT